MGEVFLISCVVRKGCDLRGLWLKDAMCIYFLAQKSEKYNSCFVEIISLLEIPEQLWMVGFWDIGNNRGESL